ncbi:DUF3173 domain-containing protein [Enterococcus sp. DIV0756]|uniref:DUF3173 domain-containing protein n=1 Tax=Enterococcus sp. DIV0756 TaxID=2774636 RepID=UPI003F25BE47
MQTICKQDLIELGYKEHTARNLICQAKKIMVQKGYPFYNNKRLGRVPTHVVESILGVNLHIEESDVIENE